MICYYCFVQVFCLIFSLFLRDIDYYIVGPCTRTVKRWTLLTCLKAGQVAWNTCNPVDTVPAFWPCDVICILFLPPPLNENNLARFGLMTSISAKWGCLSCLGALFVLAQIHQISGLACFLTTSFFLPSTCARLSLFRCFKCYWTLQ